MPTPVIGPPSAPPVRVITLPGPVTVSIYEDWNLPAGILQAWETISEEYGDSAIFLRYGWFRECWPRIDQTGKRLAIFVVEVDGGVRGICPCWVTTSRRGKLASVHALTKGPYYDWIVAAGNRAAVIAAFFEAAWKLGAPAAAIIVEPIQAASVNRAAIETELQKRKAGFAVIQWFCAPYIDLHSGPWDSYYSSLHAKFRKNLRRLRRQAEQEGPLSFEVIRRPDSLDAILAEMFEVEFRSWKGAQGTAMKCDPHSGRFYSAIAAWAMARDGLVIVTLRLAGQLIAFNLCVTCGRAIFLLKTGYDPIAAARFSPGNLMQAQFIESLFHSREFDRYDLLGVCDPWKLEWTQLTNTSTRMEIYPPTVAGWIVYSLKQGWKRPLKRSARLLSLLRRVRKRFRPAPPSGRAAA
jgi:CelD/BcsL family acetyltransferase involved in cellulose biosynthesis